MNSVSSHWRYCLPDHLYLCVQIICKPKINLANVVELVCLEREVAVVAQALEGFLCYIRTYKSPVLYLGFNRISVCINIIGLIEELYMNRTERIIISVCCFLVGILLARAIGF